MDLSKLSAPKGARRKRTRLGLGEGSGHGKTSGRGGKGQTARTGGKVRAGFEGGQMPINRRLPKYGFRSRLQWKGLNIYSVINLGSLEQLFEAGATVDPTVLEQKGLTKGGKVKAGVKILGRGELNKKLNVKVHAISGKAKARIEELGGTVEIIAAAKAGEAKAEGAQA